MEFFQETVSWLFACTSRPELEPEPNTDYSPTISNTGNPRSMLDPPVIHTSLQANPYTYPLRIQVLQIANRVESETYVADQRFYITACLEVIYTMTEDDYDRSTIKDMGPHQWFNFPRSTPFTRDDVSTILLHMDIPRSGQYWLVPFHDYGIQDQVENNGLLNDILRAVNCRLEDRHNKDCKGLTFNLRIEKKVKLQPHQHKVLASYKRAKTIQTCLEDLAKVHSTTFNSPHLSRDQWIFKISHTLEESGVHDVVDIEALNKLTDRIANMTTWDQGASSCERSHKLLSNTKETKSPRARKTPRFSNGVRLRTLHRVQPRKHKPDCCCCGYLKSMSRDCHVKPSTIQCVICLQGIRFTSSFRILTCKHAFHTRCIWTWLEHKECCPICRRHMLVEDFSGKSIYGTVL